MSFPYHIGATRQPLAKNAQKVFQGEIYEVWQWDQELYDGTTALFEHLGRPDTVQVVGVLPDETILLTEDEQPHRGPVMTPAGGRLERGESPEEGARREFLEETGYSIGTLALWHTYNPSDKIDWTSYTFVGRNLKKIAEPHLDAGEKVKPLMFTFEDFLALGSDPQLRDLVIRIALLEAQFDEAKKKALYSLFYE